MTQVMSLILILICGVSALAQGQISGKRNPEKIPESLAYFLYFNDVGHALDSEAKDPLRVKLLLQGSGLNEVEQSILKEVVITHRKNQTILVNKINSDVKTGTATKDSFIAFYKARKKYTMEAVNSVLTQASPEGAARFKEAIQGLKVNISMDEAVTEEWSLKE
jgi:hypothetical protein